VFAVSATPSQALIGSINGNGYSADGTIVSLVTNINVDLPAA
jgi:hypothetical protein